VHEGAALLCNVIVLWQLRSCTQRLYLFDRDRGDGPWNVTAYEGLGQGLSCHCSAVDLEDLIAVFQQATHVCGLQQANATKNISVHTPGTGPAKRPDETVDLEMQITNESMEARQGGRN
jgi:hypothetical protein